MMSISITDFQHSLVLMHTQFKPQKYTAAFVLLLLCSCLLQLSGAYSPDKDWLLLAARMWLQGKVLYSDIFESNPPLIVWIYALPARIALHMPVPWDARILTCTGIIACAVSIGLSTRLMAFHPQFATCPRRQAQFLLLAVLILFFTINPTYFFDREHIVMLFTFPYLLRCMPALYPAPFSTRMRLAIGTLAGVGFCIKPHSMLLFVGLQIMVTLRERKGAHLRNIENVIIYSMALAYFLLVLSFAPHYFSVILPMARATYWGYNMRSNQPFYTVVALLSLAVAFVDFRVRYTSPWRSDIYYLMGLCGLCLAYALANNGWGYSFVPLFCAIMLLVAFAGWEYGWLEEQYLAQGLPVRSFMFGRRACLFVFGAYMLASIVTGYNEATSTCARDPHCEVPKLLQALSDEHATSFGTLTIDFAPWTELARISGAKWQTRFNHLWMLPALVKGDAQFASNNAWIKTYVADALGQDLDRNAPDIVFVDTSPSFYTTRKHIDLIAYFSASQIFSGAWQRYEYSKTLNFCTLPQQGECRFLIYKILKNN